jgi:hypothetical protein
MLMWSEPRLWVHMQLNNPLSLCLTVRFFWVARTPVPPLSELLGANTAVRATL